MEQLIVGDKYKVVSFDLEYTGGRVGHDQKVVVTQLCVRHYIIVYHYCLTTRPCKYFARFVNNPDYLFITMDTTNDENVLKTTGLDCRNLVDIQCLHKILGSNKKYKASLVDLAMAIIDPYYKGMNDVYKKKKVGWHFLGEKTG
ncbi:hypothetical protein D1007_05172 [Hordeum vulgare]|nr:hypothetical protein D1007_05172 [Hordeum vulgare]